MITRREACFLILAVALGSVSAYHCPSESTCHVETGSTGIKCTKGNSGVIMYTEPFYNKIRINCINSQDWFEVHLDVTNLNINIKSLYFQECDFRSSYNFGEIARILCVTVKKSFCSSKNLTCPINKASYVDKDQLINLTELALYKTNLHSVAGFFNYTPGLKMLKLDDNGLQSIELDTFDDLKNLTWLYLSKNHLTELPLGIFDKLVSIERLHLLENNMVMLPADIFAKLKNLKFIDLSKNDFRDLPRNLLQNNTKLNSVILFGNKRNITTLPNEFFANLTELKLLNLGGNGFVTLPEDLFRGCTSLINIYLEQNYLQTLPVDIFRDLTKLKKLYLNSNDFATLPDHIFSNKRNLVKLNLSKNRITSISENLLQDLFYLEELNMEENQLMIISPYAFSNLRSLKIAKFSKNYLTLYENPDQDIYGKMSPFQHCMSLKELYLDNNNISEIFRDWNSKLLQLQKLDLNYNNISYITNADVLFRSNIEVNLTHNRIQHISLQGIERFIHLEDVHAKILVDNNPLHCDCQLNDFLRYIDSRFQNYIHIEPGKLTCQTPKELKNVRVTDLRSKSLKCEANYTACPEMCKCLERPEDNTFIFNCSQKNLTSVPNDIKKINDSFRFELNFSGNRLTHMPDLEAMGLKSVKKLILSHNNIAEISLDGLSSTIQVLELHNNNVSRIHPHVLEFLEQSTNLTRLTLHENPWKCDCDDKEFQNFIRNSTRNVTIPDLLNVKCVETNISVLAMTNFCTVNTTMIITIPLMVFLMCFFGLLYYKYQR